MDTFKRWERIAMRGIALLAGLSIVLVAALAFLAAMAAVKLGSWLGWW